MVMIVSQDDQTPKLDKRMTKNYAHIFIVTMDHKNVWKPPPWEKNCTRNQHPQQFASRLTAVDYMHIRIMKE